MVRWARGTPLGSTATNEGNVLLATVVTIREAYGDKHSHPGLTGGCYLGQITAVR